MRYKLVQHMLGDVVTSEFLAEDNEGTDQYIEVLSEDTRKHFHPETKFRVLTLEVIDELIVVPEKPMTPQQAVG